MYPYIIISHNIGHEAMIGKIIVDGFDFLDIAPAEKLYDGGKMFIEALLSKDWSYVGNTYFNLPKVNDVLKELEGEL